MVGSIKLALVIAVFSVVFAHSSALAQSTSLGVYPAEVRVDNLSPGERTEFQLTIRNNDAIARVFILDIFQPPESERGKKRARFPDISWISFSPPQVTVPGGAQANVTVAMAVPPDNRWAGQKWETWLGVTAESSDFVGLKLYVRLLVSTSGNRFDAELITVIAVVVVLLSYGLYYHFRRRVSTR